MKQILLAAVFCALAFSLSAHAGDGHKHSGKKSAHKHSKKEHMCEKCKKGEKDCVCDKHEKDDHGHANQKKETK